jgi:hypothetical protein
MKKPLHALYGLLPRLLILKVVYYRNCGFNVPGLHRVLYLLPQSDCPRARSDDPSAHRHLVAQHRGPYELAVVYGHHARGVPTPPPSAGGDRRWCGVGRDLGRGVWVRREAAKQKRLSPPPQELEVVGVVYYLVRFRV